MKDKVPQFDDLPGKGLALPSLDIVYEETEKALGVQFEQVSSLDTKLSILLGASGIILAALISGPFLLGSPQVVSVAKVLLTGATVFLMASLGCGIYGYRLFKFERPPNPEALRVHYIAEPPEETKLSIIDTILISYKKNQDMIGKKIRFIGLSFASLSAGVLFLAAGFLYNIIYG